VQNKLISLDKKDSFGYSKEKTENKFSENKFSES
jgi:hypothetical protein